MRASLLVVFLVCGSLAPALVRAQQATEVLNKYGVQPDVWRPEKLIEPGVDAGGELGLSIPVLTIPGRGGLDFPVSLSYQSGIKVSQTSSWVGLGWSFDPGSIARDVQALVVSQTSTPQNVDFAELPAYQPDQYFVTTPGGGFTMNLAVNTSQISTEMVTQGQGCLVGGKVFVPTEWHPWKIACQTGSVSVGGKTTSITRDNGNTVTPKNDFTQFVLTGEDGMRYVFAAPTLATFASNIPAAFSTEIYVATWRLVSVVSPDFNGTDLLNPQNATRGNWIKLTYTTPRTTHTFSQSGGFMQAAYLDKIETPTHWAQFHTGNRLPEVPMTWNQQGDDIHAHLSGVTLCVKGGGGTGGTCGTDRQVRSAGFVLEESNIGDYGGDSGLIRRLFLKAIYFSGSDGTALVRDANGMALPAYQFTYYPAIIPDPTEGFGPSDHVDDFGYFNTVRCKIATCPDVWLEAENRMVSWLDADTTEAKAWSLETIRYPTGGTTVVYYQNDRVVYDAQRNPGIAYATYEKDQSSSPGVATQGTYVTPGQWQGGPRVSKIERFVGSRTGAAESASTFEYGEGRISNVPTRFWERTYPSLSGLWLRVQDRKAAAVYYDYVKELRSDGTFSKTYYSNSHICSVQVYIPGAGWVPADENCRYVQWAVPLGGSATRALYYRGGENKTVLQDNAGIVWGIPFKTETNEGVPGRVATTLYEYSMGILTQAYAAPSSKTVYVFWRSGNRRSWTHVADQTTNDSTFYTYNSLDQVKTTRSRIRDLPQTVTEQTYAHEKYPAMRSLNMLSPVVQQTQYEKGAQPLYMASSITTWKTFNGGAWYPRRTFAWSNSAHSTTLPAFTAWTSDAVPGMPWPLSSTQLAYDYYGHLTETQDARGATTRLYYGDNTLNFDNNDEALGLKNSYLTGVERVQENGSLRWAIDYDPLTRAVKTVSEATPGNATGTPLVYRSFFYDAHGRLKELHAPGLGADSLLASYQYRVAGSTLSDTLLSYVKELIADAGSGVRGKTQYYDGRGREVQTQERDGTFDVLYTTRYDVHGRLYQTWNPARVTNSTHRFMIHRDSTGRDGFRGTTSRPFTEQTYDAYGRPQYLYAQDAALTGTRAKREVRYTTTTEHVSIHPDLPYTLFKTETVDEDGKLAASYADAAGRERLRRILAQTPTPSGTPANISLDAQVACGDGTLKITGTGSKSTGGKGTGVPPDSGGVTTNAVPHDCNDIKTTPTFTVPTLMRVRVSYELNQQGEGVYATLRVTGSGSGTVLDVVAFGQDHHLVGSAYFMALPGVTYTMTASALASYDYGGSAHAQGTLTFQENGTITQPLDTQFDFDAAGRLAKMMPPNYFAAPVAQREPYATLYTYNTLGQLVEKKTPDAGIEKYCYDRGGLLRFAERASDRASSKTLYFIYDLMGREKESGLLSASFATACASVNTDTYPSGTGKSDRIVKHYDAQPTGTLASGTLGIGATLNATGRLAAVESQSGGLWQTEAYQYSAALVLVTRTEVRSSGLGVDVTTNFFDKQGRLTKRQVARTPPSASTMTFTTNYTYDSRGAIWKVHAGPGAGSGTGGTPDVTYTYTAAGAVKAQQFRTFAATPYVYDVRLRLTKIGDALTDTYPFSANYTYSNAGLVTDWRQKQKGVNPFCQVFSYDAGARLSGADFQTASTTAGACTQTSNWDLSGLQYDASGNITALTRKSATGTNLDVLAYTYTPGTNRLSRVNDSGDGSGGARPGVYSYDLDGAVVGIYDDATYLQDYAMTLDRRKLPTSLYEHMNGVTASYRYSASGERYYKNVDGSVEYYLLTGSATGRSQQTGVYTGTSGQTLRHFNLLLPSGEVFGRLMGTTSRHYYAKDHLGSTRAVVDYSGAVVERHDYDAYGMELQGRGQVGSPVLNERYTGHQFDAETGLLYAGARFLDPTIGRFLSVDPLAESYSSWSPYTYTINNPVNSLDPDGRYVIFVNGQHGGKRWQAYWGKFDDPFIERYKGEGVSYVDGAMGGWANTVNTLSRGLFGLFDDSMHNIISESRFNHGYALENPRLIKFALSLPRVRQSK